MKMRSWAYAANSIHDTGLMIVSEQPLWLFLVEQIIMHVIPVLARPLWWVKFPNVLPRKRDEDSDHLYTLKEWYGSLGTVFHIHVFDRMFQWHYHHPKHKQIWIEKTYQELKEVLGDYDSKYFATQDVYRASYSGEEIANLVAKVAEMKEKKGL